MLCSKNIFNKGGSMNRFFILLSVLLCGTSLSATVIEDIPGEGARTQKRKRCDNEGRGSRVLKRQKIEQKGVTEISRENDNKNKITAFLGGLSHPLLYHILSFLDDFEGKIHNCKVRSSLIEKRTKFCYKYIHLDDVQDQIDLSHAQNHNSQGDVSYGRKWQIMELFSLISKRWTVNQQKERESFNIFMDKTGFHHFQMKKDEPGTFLRFFFQENKESFNQKRRAFNSFYQTHRDENEWFLFALEKGVDFETLDAFTNERNAIEMKIQNFLKDPVIGFSKRKKIPQGWQDFIKGFARGGLHSIEDIDAFFNAIKDNKEQLFSADAKPVDRCCIVSDLLESGLHSPAQIKSLVGLFPTYMGKGYRIDIIRSFKKNGIYSANQINAFRHAIKDNERRLFAQNTDKYVRLDIIKTLAESGFYSRNQIKSLGVLLEGMGRSICLNIIKGLNNNGIHSPQQIHAFREAINNNQDRFISLGIKRADWSPIVSCFAESGIHSAEAIESLLNAIKDNETKLFTLHMKGEIRSQMLDSIVKNGLQSSPQLEALTGLFTPDMGYGSRYAIVNEIGEYGFRSPEEIQSLGGKLTADMSDDQRNAVIKGLIRRNFINLRE